MDKYLEVLRDLKRRLTSAVLLLGELNEEEGLKTAIRQGRWESWATEYLTKMKQDEKEAEAAMGRRLTIVRQSNLR